MCLPHSVISLRSTKLAELRMYPNLKYFELYSQDILFIYMSCTLKCFSGGIDFDLSEQSTTLLITKNHEMQSSSDASFKHGIAFASGYRVSKLMERLVQ